MSVQELTPDYLQSHPLPTHEGGSKHARGCVLIIAGSVRVPGAALLAGLASLRAGAGVLQIATCRSVSPHLSLAMPEALVIGCDETSDGEINASESDRLAKMAEKADAVLIGPGMMKKEAAGALALDLLSKVRGPPFILDAAAFTSLRDRPEIWKPHAGKVLVTPHAGEMASFLDLDRADIEADMLAAAERAVAICHGIVAMKGAETYIVGDNEAWVSRYGSIALATSGSGDTLAGILAGLLARGTAPLLATQWAVYLHAAAGERLEQQHGRFGLLAREIPAEIPKIMRDLSRRSSTSKHEGQRVP